ncbi:type I-E CRISPR-associated protein Cas6/Cse3/CasE [Deinococcus arcticus]|uniref:Type I-E CRISPR-associated protein Cas6/Cse3/CasE n=1 Tax=Deinococcus arcticus TaxID=2136176 RepID=A0A2T3W9C8_9DEIO|nr:type I-E CRISPR-associated protein Cas6/Cse3/CasE [Deinococcus arcticus]PTA68496.1 type I-E CRISPR-associated protein Cas6/Cse3/CasE [Deinococcus arcticus]
MYLSRLFLSEGNRQANQDLRSPYALHQSIRWAFPGAGEAGGPLPDGERLLWRNDDSKGLLVQSVTCPDWPALEDRWPGYFRGVEVRPLNLSGLREGDRLLFRLRANVTVSRYRNGQDRAADPRTKREALRGAREQLEWLDRQGERGGFTVLGADIVQSGNVRLYKARGGAPMTLFAVTFEGLLAVENADQLAQTVQGGIGKAKSLGFGLLSLARG